MVQYHKPAKRKASGTKSKKRKFRDKRLAHYGGFFARPKISKGGEEKEVRRSFRVIGGKHKTAIKAVRFANVSTEKGVKKTRVLGVLESSADRHFARESVLVKGAIIETEAGKARVTSRPGQHGVVNAVLIEEKKQKEEKPQAPEPKPAVPEAPAEPAKEAPKSEKPA